MADRGTGREAGSGLDGAAPVGRGEVLWDRSGSSASMISQSAKPIDTTQHKTSRLLGPYRWQRREVLL